jgi:hypothetical protein
MVGAEDKAPKAALLPTVAQLAVALVPPAGLVATFRDFASHHLVLSIVLTCVYWVTLVVTRFIHGIASDLMKPRRARLLKWLDSWLDLHTTRFGRTYKSYLLTSLRFIDQKGVPTVGFYTPELDEVFIDVSLARRSPHELSGDPLADSPADMVERRSIGEFLDQLQPVVLVITGSPGSGKTTLLRYTAREICRSGQARRRTVPMLISLRDHIETMVSSPEAGLPVVLQDVLGRYVAEPAGWFEQRLRDGDCVVMLDGLDEVARDEDRKSVAGWVESQIRKYPKNDYVITSRPSRYLKAPIEGAQILQTRGFTDEQVIRFIRGWYLAVEHRSTGVEGEAVHLLAESGAEDLVERLRAAPALYELTINPLLLTMIANVHRFRGALPGSRADLYREICEVMLWRRREAKKLTAELRGEQAEKLLMLLAFQMMKRKVRDLSRSEAISVIRPGLSRASQTLTADDFLEDLKSNGLLIERENRFHSFTHHTFQEYLAATHVREKGVALLLAENVDDTWWRETTLLYVARSEADPIVQACIESGSATALALAFDCIEQGCELAPDLRKRLDKLLESAFDSSTNLQRRRLMAGVMATRHLRPAVRVGDGLLCSQPISVGLYRLFLQDMAARDESRLPDGRVPINEYSDEDAVIGIRSGDAIAFTNWLNDLTGETVYRLPTRQEMDDATVRAIMGRGVPSVWLCSNTDLPERWTNGNVDQPHSIDTKVLADQIMHDIEESTALLLRLLLTRSLAILSAVARASETARKFGFRVDAVLDYESASTLSRILNFKLDGSESLAYALNLDLDRVLDLNLARAPALDFARALDLARASDPERALGLALDRAIALALDRELDLDLALTLALDRDLALDLSRDLTLVMGEGLASSLSRALEAYWAAKRANPDVFFHEFCQTFIQGAITVQDKWVISMDALASRVRAARASLHQLFEQASDGGSRPWAYEVSIRLEEMALTIFDRAQDLTQERARAIRLSSWCLATEADIRGSSELGDAFREIAAGVSLLEERLCGQYWPVERIILAVDRL